MANGNATDDAHARDVVRKLIEGVQMAFDRDADAPQTAENMLIRLAEALHPVAEFVNELPVLGPVYANHFNELASALKDWREGRLPDLFDIQTKRKATISSLQSRARANVVLAVEALMRSGTSFTDKHRSIKTENDAAKEIIREFEQLEKALGSASARENTEFSSVIANWRTEFSRRARSQNDEAMELLEVGRDYIVHLGGDCVALHKFARQRALAADRDATWIV
jgi:hypothetical protein